MVISTGLEGLKNLPDGAVLTIGNFDGVHRGHAALLARARRLREQYGATTLAVATFEPHPFTVLRPDRVPPRLTPPQVKRALLRAQGVEHLVVLPPEPDLLNLPAEEFFAILRDKTRPAMLVEGSDFTFGKNRGGNIQRLRQWIEPTAMRLEVVSPVCLPLLDCQLVPVSSTLIRWLLAMGRVRDAAILLGRGYMIQGQIVQGYQRGRTIGVPTANLEVTDQLVPDDGVYAGRCTVGHQSYPVALSIGTMPTFGDALQRQVEAHLIGFSGDLYGQTLEVQVRDWLREQRRYDSVDALKVQLIRDLHEAEQRFGADDARPLISCG